jgi:hypothetical protein
LLQKQRWILLLWNLLMWKLLLLLLLLMLPLDELSRLLGLYGVPVRLVMQLLWAHGIGKPLADCVKVSTEIGLSCRHAFVCKSGQRYLHRMDLTAHCFDLAVSIIEALLFLVFRLLTMPCCKGLPP